MSEIVYSNRDAWQIREDLIRIGRGIGPKQASMFLRDCGLTTELAIIDRHVLEYMNAVGLVSDPGTITIAKYLQIEREFTRYAGFLGCETGILDWAVWLVMRAAKGIQ